MRKSPTISAEMLYFDIILIQKFKKKQLFKKRNFPIVFPSSAILNFVQTVILVCSIFLQYVTSKPQSTTYKL